METTDDVSLAVERKQPAGAAPPRGARPAPDGPSEIERSLPARFYLGAATTGADDDASRARRRRVSLGLGMIHGRHRRPD